MEVLSVYVASLFDTRARLPVKDLESMGIKVTSRWISEPPSTDPNGLTEAYALMCANRDIKDIRRGAFFIIDTIDATPRGGREVELGFALAIKKRTMRVGPVRNVFHTKVDLAFDDWAPALDHLRTFLGR